jgi:O-antigen/teichoic acid export membrane protein
MMTSIKENIAWNLMSNVLPFIAGVVFFPLIIDAYGLERFGLLTLAWALVGYFGLFDLGLSRALTQLVSDAIAHKKSAGDIAELIKTCFASMWLLGLLGGMVLWLSASWMVTGPLRINPSLQQESIRAFSFLAIAIPVVVHTSSMRGVLEALHLFRSASVIRMVLGVGTFLAPYLASTHNPSLVSAIIALIILRVIVWVMHYLVVKRSGILKTSSHSFNWRWIKSLFNFGGWMTVSNIIGPLMTYMDRFVIASILGVTSAAFYVAPYEVVTKMSVVPVAIAGVLFPLFAREWKHYPLKSAHRLNQGFLYTMIVLFPACLILVYFAHEWLMLWLGNEFAEEATAVVTWLVAGVLINSMAQILFAKVQGAGRSDWTAKLHLLELLPYLGLLWIMLHYFGIAGAAFAWFIRAAIDTFGLVFFVGKINQYNLHATKEALMMMVLIIAILMISFLLDSLTVRVIFASFFFLIYVGLALKQLRRDNVFVWLTNTLKRIKE